MWLFRDAARLADQHCVHLFICCLPGDKRYVYQVSPESFENARPRQLQPPPFGGHISHSLKKNTFITYLALLVENIHQCHHPDGQEQILYSWKKNNDNQCHDPDGRGSQCHDHHPQDHLDIPPQIDNELLLPHKSKARLICSWESRTGQLVSFASVVAVFLIF